MPALNEEGSIGPVIEQLLVAGVTQVRVGDNGSTDATRAVAEAAGAIVVDAPQRGYGNACLAAMADIPVMPKRWCIVMPMAPMSWRLIGMSSIRC